MIFSLKTFEIAKKDVNEAKYLLPSLLAGLFITWQGYRYFTVVNMTA